MTKRSQRVNHSPLLKGQQYNVLEHQLAPKREAASKQQTSCLLTPMCSLRTPGPTSHIRKLKKPDFKKIAATAYKIPLELTAAQRQQQLISCIHDQLLYSWIHAGVAEHVQAFCKNVLTERAKPKRECFCPIVVSFAYPASDVFVFTIVFPKRSSKACVWWGAYPRTFRKRS